MRFREVRGLVRVPREHVRVQRGLDVAEDRVVDAHGAGQGEQRIAEPRDVRQERVLGRLSSLSLAGGTQPDTAALLAAIAAAWAMDITPDLIAAGIKTFEY